MKKVILAAVAVCALASVSATAAPMTPVSPTVENGITTVQHWGGRDRHRCHHVRRTCGERWGWGSREFRHCVRHRGC